MVRRALAPEASAEGKAERCRVLLRFRPLPGGLLVPTTPVPPRNTSTQKSDRNRVRAGAEGDNSPFDLLEDDSVSVRPRDAAAGDEVNFSFDKVFDREALQEDVFKSVMEDSVDAVLRGFNATVLAYGQSGAGKTFTMFGDDAGNPGIIPRAVAEIFQRIHADTGGGIFVVKASMLEIYMEEMKDLLRPTSHKLR